MKTLICVLILCSIVSCVQTVTSFSLNLGGLPAPEFSGEFPETVGGMITEISPDNRGPGMLYHIMTIKTEKKSFDISIHNYFMGYNVVKKGDRVSIEIFPAIPESSWILHFFRNNREFLRLGRGIRWGNVFIPGWTISPGERVPVSPRSEIVEGRDWVNIRLKGPQEVIPLLPGTVIELRDSDGVMWRFLYSGASVPENLTIPKEFSSLFDFRVDWLCDRR